MHYKHTHLHKKQVSICITQVLLLCFNTETEDFTAVS